MKSPLGPVFIAFAAGIALSEGLGWGYRLVLPALLASVLAPVAARLALKSFTPLLMLPAFFFLGALFIIPWSNPLLSDGHILERLRAEARPGEAAGTAMEGEVLWAEAAPRRTRALVELSGVLGPNGWEAAEGLVQLTINGKAGLMPGDGVRTLALLSEPENFGNPGEFDFRRRLKLRGVHATGYVKSERLVVRTPSSSPGLIGGVHAFRARLSGFIDSSGAEHKEPLKALIVSGQGGIRKELKEAFAATGTAHILSISGLHVGMVAAFAFGALYFAMRRSERLLLAFSARKAALAASALPVIAYGMLAGFPVPTQRAVIMALAFMVSFALGRGKAPLNTLSLAGIIVLAVAPYSLWDVSFQLSFAAMAAIVVILPRLTALFGGKDEDGGEGFRAELKRTLKRRLLPLALTTVAAGAATAPILAWHFHRVSLAGSAANLVAVPLASVTVPALIVTAALLPVSEGLANASLFVADASFSAMAWAIRLFASLPFASAWVSPPSAVETALFYVFMLSAAGLGRYRLCRYAAPAAALALAAALAYSPGPAAGTLRVTFLSVGQGDSAFVEFPDGSNMLIDGGGSSNEDFDTGERIVAPFLRSKGVEHIDYMVVTHTQNDHMGGLRFIAENFGVRELWWSGDGDLRDLKGPLERAAARIVEVGALTRPLSIGGAEVRFLHPDREISGLDKNERSIVMRIGYGERGFLFTGDIGAKAEARLLGQTPPSTVLKAPHHGSRYSSSAAFLKEASPELVVVSAGRFNSFGFPHEETLRRYAEAGARVMRTDQDGAVTVETDGRSIEARGHKARAGI